MDQEIYNARQLAELQAPITEKELREIIEKGYAGEYELEHRVKSEAGMDRKQAQFPEHYSDNIMRIPDILGFRISVPTEEDCFIISNIIRALEPVSFLDFFTKPKSTGFKAFLYYFDESPINTEIQIMTYQMRDWTNRTHAEHEVRKYGYSFSEKNEQSKK